MITNELEPYPFCGKTTKIYASIEGGICVKCMTCHCQTFVVSDWSIASAERYSAYEKVTEAWNRRAEQ